MKDNWIPTSVFLYVKNASKTLAPELNEEFIYICTKSMDSYSKLMKKDSADACLQIYDKTEKKSNILWNGGSFFCCFVFLFFSLI